MSKGNNNTTILQMIAAIVALCVLIAFLYTGIAVKFDLPNVDILDKILGYVKYFGALGVCALLLLDFAIPRSVVLQVIVCILIAATAVFQFLAFDSVKAVIALL